MLPWRLAGIALLLAIHAADANDTLATLGAGGLIPAKSSSIRMESEDLDISAHRISVHYLFRNTSDRNVETVVAFPLPEFNGGVVGNSPVDLPSKHALNFVDFEVIANREKVIPAVEVRAFFYGPEITAKLCALGLPLSVLDQSFTSAFQKLPSSERVRLEKDGWVDCASLSSGQCLPQWQMKVQFYWTQRFPAGGTVEIVHRYRPVVGGSYITMSEDGSSSLKSYCGGQKEVDQIKRQKARYPAKPPSDTAFVEKQIQYVLTTANNWSGPIRNFRLRITADSADDIFVTCMPGFRRITATQYELLRSNFKPNQELNVLLLQSAR
jgi:hypothetical protein